MKPIRVLLVDDSRLHLTLLRQGLALDEDIEIVAEAQNGAEALERISELLPAVVIMDAVMPVMNGVACTALVMRQLPRPIIAVSEDAHQGDSLALEMLRAGAVSILRKLTAGELDDERSRRQLARQVRQAAQIPVVTRRRVERSLRSHPQVNSQVEARTAPREFKAKQGARLVCLGASTGGPHALSQILETTRLPCPIVVVQHITTGFLEGFADQLKRCTSYAVEIGESGMALRDGTVYLAPDDRHLHIDGFNLRVTADAPVSGHRPSVDVLFRSVVESGLAHQTVAALLTGMGRDGAAGLAALRLAGATTLVQDEASSTVYGMAREAVRLDAVDAQGSPSELSRWLFNLIVKGVRQ